MSIIEKKEKNLNQLINKLNSMSLTYSQPNYEVEKIKTEKNEIMRQKSFSKDFSYNNLDNKFDLTSYQDEVENNLVNKIIEELIIFINL